MPAPNQTKPRRRIMVIDDEQMIRETLSKFLAYQGHEVTTAASGLEALNLFESGKFDLVLTDYNMPGMSGDKVAGEIKRRAPREPVIAITGFLEQARQIPVPWFDACIGKPFVLAELRDLIDKYTANC